MIGMTKRQRMVHVTRKGSGLLAVLVLFSMAVFASQASERRSAPGADTRAAVSVAQPATLGATAQDMTNVEPAAETIALASAGGSIPDELVLVRSLYNLYGRWYDTASNALAETGVEPTEPRAAHVYALLSLAQNSAAVACRDQLSENGTLSDALFNRCIAGASLRILERLFPGDGNSACMAIQNPIPALNDYASLVFVLLI